MKTLADPTIRQFFREIIKFKFETLIAVVLVCAATGLSLLGPRLLGMAIDDAILPKDYSKLQQFVLIFIVTQILAVSVAILSVYSFSWLGQKVMHSIRIRMLDQYFSSPVSFLDSTPVGSLVTRATNDVSSLSELFSAGFVSMIGNIIAIVGTLASLIHLSPRLGLMVLGVFPFLIIAAVFFSGRLKIAYRAARSRLSSLNIFLAETILGMKTIFLFNRETAGFSRFEQLNESYFRAQFGSVRVYALFQPVITFFTGVAMVVVIQFGGTAAWHGSLKLGVLTTFFAYALSLFQPVFEIADKWNVFLSGMASAERVFDTLSQAKEVSGNFTRSEVKKNTHPLIEFRNVGFYYGDIDVPETDWAIKPLNLAISAGEHLGLVGPTGSGKTTFLQLLLRFRDVKRGTVLLKGHDIRDWKLSDLRSHFGWIQQEGFLFSGSIAENISFGSIGQAESVRTWLDRQVEFPELQSLSSRVGFNLNERGGNLSAGERQLIAFARVLYRNPEIWLLDEATSSLDHQTEQGLETLFRRASVQKTTVTIAHRLSSVMNCDRILFLGKGQILEAGSHAELLRLGGEYAKLWQVEASQLQRNLPNGNPTDKPLLVDTTSRPSSGVSVQLK